MRRYLELGAGFIAGAAAAESLRKFFSAARRTSRPSANIAENGEIDDPASPPNLIQSEQPGRGREAQRPAAIPVRGWKDILIRTVKEFEDDQIALIAAGCTFYTLLALFPGVTAFAALYGLFADIGDAQQHVQALSGLLPAGAISLIGDQMNKVAAAGDGGLSLTFALGLGTALWSANKAMKAVITGMNIAYEEKDKRGFALKTVVPLAFTFGLIAFGLAAVGLAALGALVSDLYGGLVGAAYSLCYWILLFGAVVAGMALLYRFGPSRSRVRWRWVTWGSGLAAVIWVAMSAAFSFYVSNFGNYDETYGALGAVVGFMTWTWLSSMVVLMGAELNAEIEHQTARDTTTGASRPLGSRGAMMADTIGRST